MMSADLTIDIEEILEHAFRKAFLRALEPIAQAKAEELCKRMLEAGSPLSKQLEEKFEQGFQRFLAEGIRWEKKKTIFKK